MRRLVKLAEDIGKRLGVWAQLLIAIVYFLVGLGMVTILKMVGWLPP